jgi:hypothetical protein
MSSPAANFLSKSVAFVFIKSNLLRPGTPDGNDADSITPVSDNARPMPVADFTDHQETRLAAGHGGNLQQVWVDPEYLGFAEVDPVFGLVGGTPARVELESHGIENIPIWYINVKKQEEGEKILEGARGRVGEREMSQYRGNHAFGGTGLVSGCRGKP